MNDTSIDPKSSPDTFALALTQLGLRRAALFWNAEQGRLTCSHPALSALAESAISNTRDFDAHQAAFFEVGPKTGSVHAAFLHQTHRGQAAGGVRRWQYASIEALMTDGLRLSRGMGRKNALAGLWWGGGKGIISEPPQGTEQDRGAVYQEYGAFVSSLRGAYVTAEDVGTVEEDMANVFRATRFTTCVPLGVGGSGNPSSATARGVVTAMEAALEFQTGDALTGKTVVMQGAGNVARFMMRDLLSRGVSKIIASDISPHALRLARTEVASERLELRETAADDETMFREECDIFAPNALGGVLHDTSIPQLRASLVCGAANNQLLDDQVHDRTLAALGIQLVPDFLGNRMGIVQCSNEQYGSVAKDPAIERHFSRDWNDSLYNVTRRVLERAKQTGTTSTRAANELADELSAQQHPLWPGRTAQILQGLANRWVADGTFNNPAG